MLSWEELKIECESCNKCDLASTRKNVVIGRGNSNAIMMLVGEGPGKEEDETGLPFVGAAGKLLDLLLEAMMINEDKYYIGNIVKCRPPENRVPFESEAIKCLPYLRNQVALIRPRIIVCMGSTAAKYIIRKDISITKDRGQWTVRKGCWIMPTFHPAALLRDQSKKVLMWEDFKKVKQKIDEMEAGGNCFEQQAGETEDFI